MNDIEGTVWRFGDHVNTDVIHPPDWFSLDPETVRTGLFRRFDPSLQARFRPGDLLVAGCNFGCGSSRETSVRSLTLNRVGAILAQSFARIFFRNATNAGIPCLVFADPGDLERVAAGRTARVSVADWTLTLDDGARVALEPVPEFVVRIWRAGGLLETLPPAGP